MSGLDVTMGEAVRSLYRLGRLFAAGIRVTTTVPTVIIALLAAPAGKMWLVTVAMTVVTAWSALYVLQLLRGPARWYTLLDALILMSLCFATQWLVPDEWLVAGHSWIMAFTSFACVAYQCHTEWLLGLVVTSGVVGALVVGSAAAAPTGSPVDILITTTWTVMVALLARLLWVLIRRSGVQADQAMADAEQARTRQRVTAAVRADETALANALHDTAATTLLMVGSGQIPQDGTLLAAQAERDLSVMRTYGEHVPGRSDLSSLLRAVTQLVPARVSLDENGPVHLPGSVASAIADATGEALNNVVKHAMVDSAVVRVRGDGHKVLVEIIDQGCGFDPGSVGGTRRGLRESIRGRMARIDGQAHVSSAAGQGTSVRLEWADA